MSETSPAETKLNLLLQMSRERVAKLEAAHDDISVALHLTVGNLETAKSIIQGQAAKIQALETEIVEIMERADPDSDEVEQASDGPTLVPDSTADAGD